MRYQFIKQPDWNMSKTIRFNFEIVTTENILPPLFVGWFWKLSLVALSRLHRHPKCEHQQRIAFMLLENETWTTNNKKKLWTRQKRMKWIWSFLEWKRWIQQQWRFLATLATCPMGCQCWSVHHVGPDWNIATTIQWIVQTFVVFRGWILMTFLVFFWLFI